jgi:hypothetical protein
MKGGQGEGEGEENQGFMGSVTRLLQGIDDEAGENPDSIDPSLAAIIDNIRKNELNIMSYIENFLNSHLKV